MRSGLHDRDPGVAGNIEEEGEVVVVDADGRMVVAAGEVAEVEMTADRASLAASRVISSAIALAKMMRANTADQRTCFDKKNEAPRMQRAGVRTSRQNAFVGEFEDMGHGEGVVGEANVGMTSQEEVWLYDGGASHHTCGDRSKFKTLIDIPKDFILHQLQGSVKVEKWGTVELDTDGECGGITLHECLFIPGIRVNLFSGQKLRQAAWSYTCGGKPGGIISVNTEAGKQVCTLREAISGRHTLICSPVKHRKSTEGEAVVAAIDVNCLHGRMGHASE